MVLKLKQPQPAKQAQEEFVASNRHLAFNRGRLTVEPVNAPSQGLVGKMSP
ncbi:hypothetical protein QEG98_24285 [Myxococcus sp. MxC21-1]|uniref:hypothetical protein n=1 Tax=Myxococcus sp. MxC21-1 TaxID=3041439 RepID=UPI002930492A|nr:hypothetical protein [Myxococcus sp. MxC21-1]WNZ59207.1 hypothetical protein QEG98_24285 [Myxococcus sp. MxC21-1]